MLRSTFVNNSLELSISLDISLHSLLLLRSLYSEHEKKIIHCQTIAISYCWNIIRKSYTLCSEKNTHSHFPSYLHELFVDLNKNCSEYTQGLSDSDNVKIRYSFRSMT